MKRHPVILQDMEQISSAELPWEDLAGKVVLITGAAGFLPAYMVEFLLYLNEHRLSANPCRVIGLVRNEEKAARRFAALAGGEGFSLLVQDASDAVDIDGPVDYIIHAASQASPKYYGTDPVGTLSPNVLGTMRLLALAHQKKSRRFMFFSTAEVYGTVPDGRIKESDYGYLDPLDVRSCYAEGKRMGENMVASWQHQFGVPAVVVRPFHTYGPGMDRHDGRVFADFVADVVAGRDIVMKSAGTAVRSFCYLADAVAGFFTVLFKGADGEAYNIGNDDATISIAGLAELLASLYPERTISVVKREASGDHRYLPSPHDRVSPDTSKARGLGWAPVTGLADGFKRTMSSFEPFESGA